MTTQQAKPAKASRKAADGDAPAPTNRRARGKAPPAAAASALAPTSKPAPDAPESAVAPDTAPASTPKAAPPAPAASAATGPKPPSGKLGIVADLLRRPQGATVAQLGEATGWQAHSVRGALAGALKKKHGLAIVSASAEGGRVYRIADGAAA